MGMGMGMGMGNKVGEGLPLFVRQKSKRVFAADDLRLSAGRELSASFPFFLFPFFLFPS
jgi:hypothetical protein